MIENLSAHDKTFLRSYLPERYLIKERDIIALKEKYQRRDTSEIMQRRVLMKMTDLALALGGIERRVTGEEIVFGSLRATFDETGLKFDETIHPDFAVVNNSPRVRLDFQNITGPHASLCDAQRMADFFAQEAKARDKDAAEMYFFGFTHPHMARLAQRMGFQVGDIDEGTINNDVEKNIQSIKSIYNAVNAVNHKKDPPPFKVMGVSMRMDHFIESFGSESVRPSTAQASDR